MLTTATSSPTQEFNLGTARLPEQVLPIPNCWGSGNNRHRRVAPCQPVMGLRLRAGRAREEVSEVAKGTKIGRDAGSGKFIPVKTAQGRPKTAVVETIKKGKK